MEVAVKLQSNTTFCVFFRMGKLPKYVNIVYLTPSYSIEPAVVVELSVVFCMPHAVSGTNSGKSVGVVYKNLP